MLEEYEDLVRQWRAGQEFIEVTVVHFEGHENRLTLRGDEILSINEVTPDRFSFELEDFLTRKAMAATTEEAQRAYMEMTDAVKREFGSDEDEP